MMQTPGIHQQVARAAVISRHCPTGRKAREIADSPYVYNDPVVFGMAEQHAVKRWNQRSALSARGNITASEIPDDRDTCEFGEQGGIKQLNGIGTLCVRTVAHGLTVTTYRSHFPLSNPAVFE